MFAHLNDVIVGANEFLGRLGEVYRIIWSDRRV